MPRKPRYYLAGVPSHVIQRGHNREPCFAAPEDFRYYLQCLREACLTYEATIHAYVLMTNHVHLLMTPDKVDSISRVLQSVGRRYVQYVNTSYRRSGTLWEGRHKASLIDSEHYLMSCYRYIELNPVRAGIVKRPGDYPWSSYGANAHGREDALTQAHDVYEALGRSAEARQGAYRDLFRQQVDPDSIRDLRTAINLCVPVGSDRFKAQVERRLKQRISYLPRGRPRKDPSSEE
ncbi:transposase [Solimonas sp. K1W22B-7]|uniref:REP-associated tyrosine transposase n=1 Tax=Solimonas sp. K1W22B-7 TaxID=2303331 RepID=UPI000E330DF6|nr:transposase [Solimonas sp. K1W22B-7]AXQ31163.1 transposase [Solimonas sp. K1W22B-7]